MDETPYNDSINLTSWKLVLMIMILAAFFRLWGAFDLYEFIEDEKLHVPTAISVGEYGTTVGWGWHHPQLSGLIVYGTLHMFGDNPIGWRSSNIFFGTASVGLVFLIGRLLYPGTAVATLAAALLAFEPHHIYISRTTFIEIPVTFFFLLYLYLLLEYTENRRPTLPLAGIAMGLTIATKAYFVFAIPLAALYALCRQRQQGALTLQVMVNFAATLLLLPCTVYLLSYYWWFARGFTLPDFFRMKLDAVWALQKLDDSNFINIAYMRAGGKPWEWFVKPIFWGHQRLLNSEEGIFLLKCNNPPFRLLVIPSVCAASIYAYRLKSLREFLAPLLFVSCFMLILLARRPMFSYSAMVLLPFAYLCLAKAVTICAIKINREKLVYACFLSATLIWCAYMFPILSARLIPIAPYRPILSLVRFLGNF